MKILVIASLLISTNVFASEILRDASGNIRHMNQWEASGLNSETWKREKPDVCEVAGKGRLPSVRELAELAQANGAKGILELSQVDPNDIPPGYYEIWKDDAGVMKADFYFNQRGYTRPANDLSGQHFWAAAGTEDYKYYGYMIGGDDGIVANTFAGAPDVAVLCVPK